MDTLTRVMSRYVYNINLHDLPLERQLDKNKRRFRSRVMTEIKSESNRTNSEGKTVSDNSEVKPIKRIRSSSGDTPSNQSKSVSPQISHITVHRSRSDSHLLKEKSLKYQNRKDSHSFKSEHRYDLPNRCRSLEFDNRIESPIWSESSVSRSPSPTHSNVIENNSLKDSPMNLEGGHTGNNSGADTAKSVLVGGTYRGWSSESAFILWRRMLGILGDVNKLSNPQIHAQAMECLVKIIEDLIKVKENLGVIVDNQVVGDPSLEPPLHYFSSWLFKATQLPNEFKAGKLLAYKLLCLTIVRRNETELPKELLSLFYLTLRQGLMSYDPVLQPID